MSGTFLLKGLLVLAVFSAAPINALAFDFDKELAKQNNISVEVLAKKGQQAADEIKKEDKSLKVTLIARKR